MKTLLLIAVSMIPLLSADVEKKVAPTVLTEVEQLKVEKLQLQLELLDSRRQDASQALTAIFNEKCIAAGGKKIDDCNITPPSAQQPRYVIQVKPAEKK